MFDKVTWHAIRKQTFRELKGMRLVIFESALGSRSKAEALERSLEEYMHKKEIEIMANKDKKKEKKGKAKGTGKGKDKKDYNKKW